MRIRLKMQYVSLKEIPRTPLQLPCSAMFLFDRLIITSLMKRRALRFSLTFSAYALLRIEFKLFCCSCAIDRIFSARSEAFRCPGQQLWFKMIPRFSPMAFFQSRNPSFMNMVFVVFLLLFKLYRIWEEQLQIPSKQLFKQGYHFTWKPGIFNNYNIFSSKISIWHKKSIIRIIFLSSSKKFY